MAVQSLHHFNIRAPQAELLALCGAYPVLHLTVAPASESLPGVGDRHSAADHIAFRCSDLEGALERLRRHGVAHSIDKVPLVNEVQIFLRDPSGVGVELNFADAGAPSPSG
jgi:hypothetical protein